MSAHTPLISDFTAGELGPYFYGRSDQPAYFKGVSLMKNFIPKTQGGFFKRPGTLVLGHTNGDAAARFIPFIISTGTVYVLEFTNNLIRVWKNGVWLGVGTNIVTTYTTAEIPDIQVWPFFPDLFITHQNHIPARIRWTTPNTLTLSTLTFKTATLTFTGTSVNGANTITGVNTNLLPAEAIWFLTGPGITAGTYLTLVAPTTGTSPLTYTVTMSANAGAGAAAGTFTLTLQPIPFLPTSGASTGNWPRTCAIAYQRLWFGNTTNQPQTFWQSIVGIWDASDPVGATGLVGMAWSDITTFSVPVLQQNADGTPTTNPPTYLPTAQVEDQVNDADAGAYTINAERDDEIYWLLPMLDLLVGTSSGEWIVPSKGNPNTMEAQKISSVTDMTIQPTLVTGGTIFMQRLGRRVYRLDWQGANNPFQPPQDLTFFSEHMFISNPITAYAAQATPDFILWFLRTDGTLACLLFNIAFGIMAWWQFVTSGTVVSLCVVPGTDFQSLADRDIVYLCVQRGASTYVEQVATPFWTDNKQAVFSDCATYKSAASFTTMAVDTGLNGQTLEVVADGAYIGTAVPVAGVLTLPGGKSALKAVAGLNFVSTMTSMPIVPQTQEGTGQLKKGSVPKSRFRVVNTLYMKAGQFTVANPSGTPGLSNVRLGGEGPALDYTVAGTAPYSGYARSSILEALRDDCYLSVVSDLPLPCAVSAIVPDIEQAEQ